MLIIVELKSEDNVYQIIYRKPSNFSQQVKFLLEHKELVYLNPPQVFVEAGHLSNNTIYVYAQKPGKTDILLEVHINHGATEINGSMPE